MSLKKRQINSGSFKRGFLTSLETIAKRILLMTGQKRTEETKLKMSLAQKGKKLSKEHIEKLRVSKSKIKGKNNPNWKGGIEKVNEKKRHTREIKLFKKSCLERDNFTCQISKQIGGYLVVHHINNFSNFPELRTSIENGITLSRKIHQDFHKKYGFRNNTREQLVEFSNTFQGYLMGTQ